MAASVILNGTRLQVNDVTVRKDWGFTRKGASVNPVVYVVTRYGRNDVSFERHVQAYGSTAGRRDLTGFAYSAGERRSEFVMTHTEFARFVEKYYGATREAGETAQQERHRATIAAQRQQLSALQSAQAHQEANTMVESIREALGSYAGIYAVMDLLYAARAEGFEAGTDDGYENCYESGYHSGASTYDEY